MLLTKREEQLVKAFQEYGKLSLENIVELLDVSKRTVYRTLTDLSETLAPYDIRIEKEQHRYQLVGSLDRLGIVQSQEEFTSRERRYLILYDLLRAEREVTNEELQGTYQVSNVTVIQDIAIIEERITGFGATLQRQKGYVIQAPVEIRRHLMAILLTNVVPHSQFIKGNDESFAEFGQELTDAARRVLAAYRSDLPEMDDQLFQFFANCLSLAGVGTVETNQRPVSKLALDTSQKLFAALSSESHRYFPLAEILSFASCLDHFLIKRQSSPLFQEHFDSSFFYSLTNFIDKVQEYTKIPFSKDPLLFRFLFNHIRLNLAVPTLFPDASTSKVTQLALRRDDYLHRVVSLLVVDIFPAYLQNETEYAWITLHFAASLRRSPDTYPIRMLLLTDERPLATELLVTRLKSVAPFINEVVVKPLSASTDELDLYDVVLSTGLVHDPSVHQVSSYPDTKELLELQETLQEIQTCVGGRSQPSSLVLNEKATNLLTASQELLESFTWIQVDNPSDFVQTVPLILRQIAGIQDVDYLSQKLVSRFELSPLAIPETHLALLHTQSHQIAKTSFTVVELKQAVRAMSMAQEEEEIHRVLVMLTKLDETEEVRQLMTAISQSVIENKLYTEIYKTGNAEIIYHLLNQIFTEKIKKLEN